MQLVRDIKGSGKHSSKISGKGKGAGKGRPCGRAGRGGEEVALGD